VSIRPITIATDETGMVLLLILISISTSSGNEYSGSFSLNLPN